MREWRHRGTETIRECKHCGISKELSEFPNGYGSYCQRCRNVRRRKPLKFVVRKTQEELKAKKHQWYLRHRDEIYVRAHARLLARRIRDQKWRDEHREEWRARMNAWRAANPDKVKNHLANERGKRRTQMKQAGYEKIDRQVVFERANGLCAYCGVSLLDQVFHLDHMIPLSRGGSHTYNNVTATCRTCNISQGAKTPAEFLAIRVAA